DGIRDLIVTGVQTCALPIFETTTSSSHAASQSGSQDGLWKLSKPRVAGFSVKVIEWQPFAATRRTSAAARSMSHRGVMAIGMKQIGRASCRERGWVAGGDVG